MTGRPETSGSCKFAHGRGARNQRPALVLAATRRFPVKAFIVKRYNNNLLIVARRIQLHISSSASRKARPAISSAVPPRRLCRVYVNFSRRIALKAMVRSRRAKIPIVPSLTCLSYRSFVPLYLKPMQTRARRLPDKSIRYHPFSLFLFFFPRE